MSKYKVGQLLRCKYRWHRDIEEGWSALISQPDGRNSEGGRVWKIVFFPPREVGSEFNRWSETNLNRHWEIVGEPDA